MKFGVERLVEDLKSLGFNNVTVIEDKANNVYALIPKYQIPAGSFAGRFIDLAIPAPSQYPQQFGASIHIKAEPPLVEKVPVHNVRNVIDSDLGTDWQYWSYRFNVGPMNPTAEFISQINGIFRKN